MIRGTRISVEQILTLLGEGWTNDQILENYLRLSKRDIEAGLNYAAETLRKVRVGHYRLKEQKLISSKRMSSEYARRKLRMQTVERAEKALKAARPVPKGTAAKLVREDRDSGH